MPEKKHCYHSSAYYSPKCDFNIYSKLWAVDSWPGVCLQIMMWTQMMLFMTMKQTFRRPRPKKRTHHDQEIIYMHCLKYLPMSIKNSFSSFWLLWSIAKRYKSSIMKYAVTPVLFDSPLSCLNLIYTHWLDTCKYSCFRWERMSHMEISHELDRGAML